MADRVEAINADVVWRSNTGQTERDIESLRRTFYESTNQMSTQALRLQSAQEKLDRALLRHGPTSRQAREAEVALRREMDAATNATRRHTAATERDERELGRMTRGAVVGTGALRGLARTVAFASTSFLGSFGLVYALKSSVDEFRNHEVVVARVRNAIQRAGLDYRDYAKQIDATIQAQARLSAFDDEELLDTFGRLVVRTKDVNEALRLNGLAADVARGRNIDLEAATQLVIKASIGQAGQLRRLGIDVDKNAKATELLAALQDRYAGSAERFGKSSLGASERAKKSFHDIEEIVGRGAAPAIDDLATSFANWADKAENQRRIQRDVNEVVRTGTAVAHGLADGLRDIESVVEPVVHGLGGVENTAKLMIEAFALYKLAKIATGIRGIGLAWRFVGREATIAAGAEGAAAAAGGGAGRPGRAGALAGVPLGLAAAEALTILSIPNAGGGGSAHDPLLGKRAGAQYPELDKLGRSNRELTPSELYIYGLYRRGLLTAAQAESALKNLHRTSLPPTPTNEDVAARGARARTTGPARGSGGGGPGRKHGFELTYALQLEAARAAAGQGTPLAAAQDALRYVKAQIASGRLNKQGLLDALAEEAQLEEQIDGILEARDAKKRDADLKRTAAAKKRAEEARRRAAAEKARLAKQREEYRDELGLDERKLLNARLKAELTSTLYDDRKASAALIDFYRREAHDKHLTEKEREEYATKALQARKAAQTKKKTAGPGIDFFAEAADEFRTYGSNIGGVLSGQDARGLLAGIALTLRSIDRHSKTTAGHTGKIFTGGNPAKVAAALADVGAWTQ